jgi:hypothetical protein
LFEDLGTKAELGKSSHAGIICCRRRAGFAGKEKGKREKGKEKREKRKET